MWPLLISFVLLLGAFCYLINTFVSTNSFVLLRQWHVHPESSSFINKQMDVSSSSTLESDIFNIFSNKDKTRSVSSECNDLEKGMSKIRQDLSDLIDSDSMKLKAKNFDSESNNFSHQLVKRSTNDFAYVTVVPAGHDLDPIVNETAAAWCQSIRTIHTARSNFDIVAVFSSSTSSRNFHTEKYKCFDKLVFVDESVVGYLANLHDSVDMDVVSKLWLFSLVHYKRVIFLKHNLAPVRSNIYNYFFKDYYLTGKTGKDRQLNAPKKLYTQSSMLSPINSNFMSLEPNIDTAVELLSIYALRKWDADSGWMCYGSFNFDPVSRMESFESSFEPAMSYQLNKKKQVRPWKDSAWSFDSSWLDTGLLFYYHYLIHSELSGIIYELDFDHSLIEYVSYCFDTYSCYFCSLLYPLVI